MTKWRLQSRFSRLVKAGMEFRVIGIKTDEHIGVTEDDPYCLLDTAEVGPDSKYYYARRSDFGLVGRP